MDRLSYGGDLFSPVRSDISFNNSNNENSKTSVASGDLLDVPRKIISSKDDYEFSERRKKNSPLKEVTMHHKNRKVESSKTKSKRSDKPVSNSNTVIIAPCAKTETAPEMPIKELPRKSKRLQNHEERIGGNKIESKSLNSQSSSTHTSMLSKRQGKGFNMSFITVRGRDSNKDRGASCSKNVSAFTTTPSILEENASSLEISSKTSTADDSVFTSSIISEVSIGVEPHSPDEATLHSQQNEDVGVVDSKASPCNDSVFITLPTISETSNKTDTPMPTDQATLYLRRKEDVHVAGSKAPSTDNSKLENTVQSECKVASNKSNSGLKNTIEDFSGIPAVPNEPDQIQAKIIKKLITEAVNSQFDIIRQQLYLQQISILKVLNETREEFENRESKHMENLYKIIEVLSEENRLLKTAIMARR